MRLASKWQYAIVIAVSSLVLGVYQATPSFTDPDSYYHAEIVQQLLQHGLVLDFPWLPFTTLAQDFSDHHLVYHLLLMPFVAGLGPVLGLKVFQVLSGTVLLTILFALLKRWQLPYALVAMPLLFTSYPFVIRLNLVKASTLAIAMFVVILWLLWERRYAWVAVVTMLYSLTHGGFVLAILAAIAVWLGELFETRKFVVPTGLFVTVAGCALGVVASPYFPANLPFLWAQLFQIGVVNYQTVISVGAEWYPFALPDLISYLSILLIVALAALIVVVLDRKQNLLNRVVVSLWLLTVGFFVLTLRSRRFIEYLVPILWLGVVIVVLPRAKQLWLQCHQQLGRWWLVISVYVVSAALFSLFMVTTGAGATFASNRPVNEWQPVAEVLNTLPTGSRVFHGAWHDFPPLFYASPKHEYIVGLDATFLYLASAKQYRQWDDISSGRAKLESAQRVREEFAAQYIFINKTEEHTKLFYAYLLRDPSLSVLLDQGDFVIFQL